MKKYLIILCLCFNIVFVKEQQAAVTAYLNYAVFETPGQGPYLETYISVIGSSVKAVKNQHSKYQGAVEIAIRFIQNHEIKSARKYVLNGPETTDTLNSPNFIDQQRFVLPNGAYTMEITIVDKNKPDQHPFLTNIPVKVNMPVDKIAISDIQLLESYGKSTASSVLTKSGYDLVPYVSSLFPENISKLKFYSEIYHTLGTVGEAEKIVINYFLESSEKQLKNVSYASFLKAVTSEVNVVLGELNIENLPTGNYNLVIEVRDKENKLLADQRSSFQRINKEIPLNKERMQAIDVSNSFVSAYKNTDTLSEYIRSLRPISGSTEIQFAENLLKESKLELQQQYLYNFWTTRNAKEAETAWLAYHKEVLKVNKQFATYSIKGYDTDRGRVYLQYGAPDSRNAVSAEPSVYPYEIWQYNSLINKSIILTNPNNRQSNKRFVFYNPDLVSNKYMLIHSDARGEIMNTRWQMLLNKRNVTSTNFDDEKVDDNFGGGVNDNYINPK